MLRNILGAVVGYVVMFVMIFVVFSIAYMFLGAGGSFRPGSYEVAGAWIAITIVLSVVAAIAGGYVCKGIAKSDTGVRILMGVVLVLGVVSAFITMSAEPVPGMRPEEVPLLEAMSNGVQPMWLSWLTPIIGVVGVWYGGKLRSDVPPEQTV